MADSQIQPPGAEVVDTGHRRRELQGIVQVIEHRDARPRPGGTRGGIGQHLLRGSPVEMWSR